MIAACDGVEVVRKPRFFDNDVFCEFTINGHKFYVEEPYGDNTSYDVVAPEANLKELDSLARQIESMSPIKGGDIGHQIYFLTTYLIGGGLLFVIVLAILRLFSG